MINKGINSLLSIFAELFARVTIAWIFILSGWGKFQHLDQVIEFFNSLGIPYARLQAPFVATIEIIAGALVLIGFKTKWASLPLMGIMIVAIRTAKWEEVTDLSSLANLSEFLIIIILLGLFANGSRYLSVDSRKKTPSR